MYTHALHSLLLASYLCSIVLAEILAVTIQLHCTYISIDQRVHVIT
jgi:hypothetical protein